MAPLTSVMPVCLRMSLVLKSRRRPVLILRGAIHFVFVLIDCSRSGGIRQVPLSNCGIEFGVVSAASGDTFVRTNIEINGQRSLGGVFARRWW